MQRVVARARQQRGDEMVVDAAAADGVAANFAGVDGARCHGGRVNDGDGRAGPAAGEVVEEAAVVDVEDEIGVVGVREDDTFVVVGETAVRDRDAEDRLRERKSLDALRDIIREGAACEVDRGDRRAACLEIETIGTKGTVPRVLGHHVRHFQLRERAGAVVDGHVHFSGGADERVGDARRVRAAGRGAGEAVGSDWIAKADAGFVRRIAVVHEAAPVEDQAVDVLAEDAVGRAAVDVHPRQGNACDVVELNAVPGRVLNRAARAVLRRCAVAGDGEAAGAVGEADAVRAACGRDAAESDVQRAAREIDRDAGGVGDGGLDGGEGAHACAAHRSAATVVEIQSAHQVA